MEETKKINVTLAQIELNGGGMSYVVCLKDGKFILIDGGQNFELDGERLFNYLMTKTGGEKPVVSAWLFTHGHCDHIRLATDFIKNYKDKIVVENIIYNVPKGNEYNGYDSSFNDVKFEEEFFAMLEKRKDINSVEVKTRDVFNFEGVEIIALNTAFDRYPENPGDRNQTSAVFKLIFDNGISFMVLGDAMGSRLVEMTNPSSTIYCNDKELKSDILQVAHHGLCIGGEEQYGALTTLYKKIAPKICFWPIGATRFYNDPWCQSEKHPYHRFLFGSAKDKNFHQSQTIEIDIQTLAIKLIKY
jgi:beta-lactamase superfamily II metal-dependent hydrolase